MQAGAILQRECFLVTVTYIMPFWGLADCDFQAHPKARLTKKNHVDFVIGGGQIFRSDAGSQA